MVNGRIIVYGTPGHLMHQYGGGYNVQITLDAPMVHSVIQSLKTKCEGTIELKFE
jgi:hypothetical protein